MRRRNFLILWRILRLRELLLLRQECVLRSYDIVILRLHLLRRNLVCLAYHLTSWSLIIASILLLNQGLSLNRVERLHYQVAVRVNFILIVHLVVWILVERLSNDSLNIFFNRCLLQKPLTLLLCCCLLKLLAKLTITIQAFNLNSLFRLRIFVLLNSLLCLRLIVLIQHFNISI